MLFLPKYSPDLNPIEKLFAKIKHWLREAQARSRQVIYDELTRRLATMRKLLHRSGMNEPKTSRSKLTQRVGECGHEVLRIDAHRGVAARGARMRV